MFHSYTFLINQVKGGLPHMKIYEIHQKKRTYMPLLLLADEQPEMIETYLSRGRMLSLIHI